MSDDKIKESDNNEVNVDDYQAKEETTLTKSDMPRQNGEKNRKDNDDEDKEDRKENRDKEEGSNSYWICRKKVISKVNKLNIKIEIKSADIVIKYCPLFFLF